MKQYIVLTPYNSTYEIMKAESAEALAKTLGAEIDTLCDRPAAYQIFPIDAVAKFMDNAY